MEEKDTALTQGEVAVMAEIVTKKKMLEGQLQMVDSWISDIVKQILGHRGVNSSEYMISMLDWKIIPIKKEQINVEQE